jgi:hypothetical protein
MEVEKNSLIEIMDILDSVQSMLIERISNQLLPLSVKCVLNTLDISKPEKAAVIASLLTVYDNVLEYIEQWSLI